ncbi:MAG: hypothetical protein V2J20_11325, partial [Wenzhouxiangella sp.]|nr:hypothetical protein [Wenzhouxiangella sp.]
AVTDSDTVVTVTVDFGGAYLQTEQLALALSEPTGLWAQGTNADGIDWTGGASTVEGLVHSNGDINIRGAKKTVNGPTRYVGKLSVKGNSHTFSSTPEQVEPAAWPFAFDSASYAPGGSLAVALGGQYFDMSKVCDADGNWSLERNMAPGVYWVPCEVRTKGSGIEASVTVVSTDKIRVNGARHEITPFVDGLAFITTSNDKNAIRISSSRSDIGGFVVARQGGIVLSGSRQNIGCGVAANELTLRGSNHTVGEDCPASPRPDSADTISTIEPLALEASTEVISVGEPVTVTGRVTNLDEFTESATIDWGDGTVETLQLVEENDHWAFAATHEYAEARAFTVLVVTVDFGGTYQQTEKLEFAVSGPTGLWAQGSTAGGIEWTGGANTVDGLVHSNSDIDIKGARKTVNGLTRYAGHLSVKGSGHTFASPPEQMAPAVWPFAFEPASYAPDSDLAVALDDQYFDMSEACDADGRWELDRNTAPGLYWVPCEVRTKGSRIVANVTVVSTEAINLTGSRHEITPFVDGLAFLTQFDDRGAIQVSSSNSDFKGFLVARNGEIAVSSSGQNFGCGLAAKEIKLSGANRTVGQNCVVSTE